MKKKLKSDYFAVNDDEDEEIVRKKPINKKRKKRRKNISARPVGRPPKKTSEKRPVGRPPKDKSSSTIKVRSGLLFKDVPKKLKLDGRKIKHHDIENDDPEVDEKIAEKNESLFAKKLEQIHKAQNSNAFPESILLLTYQGLLDMVLDLIPIAEEKYRTTKIHFSAYALNTYINQARLIAVDMRALQDFEEQANKINEMIRGQYTMVAQNMVDEIYSLKKLMREKLLKNERIKFEKQLEIMQRRQGRFLNESVKMLNSLISDFLTTRPSTREAGAGKAAPNE